MRSDYDTQTRQIAIGWDVFDSNGDEIGDVYEVGPNYIMVEKGWLFPSNIYIPTSAISSVQPDRVQLNLAKDAIGSRDWTAPPGTQRGDVEQATLERREERLEVDKQPIQTGEVRIRREVVPEQQSVDVPVTREEVDISTRSVDRPATEASFQDQEVAVPVFEDQVTTSKEARVVEELNVEKVARKETARVTDTVRREEFHIDETGEKR